ncbi:hypothetical protein SUGI_1074950 [Cryptomeria japonica]|nr:hypothetical protein SUGI_1074950 [Cryptomeria japonica]
MPPRRVLRGHDKGRGRGEEINHFDVEDFNALRRQVEALKEKLRRGVGDRRRDYKNEEEDESEASSQSSSDQELAVVANDPLIRAISRIGKRP